MYRDKYTNLQLVYSLTFILNEFLILQFNIHNAFI
jgi:hypothetical protein